MDDESKLLDHLNALSDIQGVACSTVSNGHMIAIKTDYLRQLLEKYGDKPKVIFFIHRPDLQG
jgi:hypothetical protein